MKREKGKIKVGMIKRIKFKMYLRKITNCLGVLFISLFTFHFSLFTCEAAHTYHISLTRMDYNEKEKLVEITVQLFTHDLQPLLEKRLKKQVDLEKTPEVDGEIFKYLGENFVFQNKKGETQKLKWVGREFDEDMVYVYIEIPFSESLEGTKLQNTIFFESFPEQSNIVTAHFNSKKAALLFVAGDKFKELISEK
ncbi:hypothetical protein BH10ACI1_BH10ACI1_29650 [soil metagenome]